MAIQRVGGVAVRHWNPRRSIGHYPIRFKIGPRIGNFGDLLGPLLVRRLLDRKSGSILVAAEQQRYLLTIGSIMAMAKSGDCVWGTGVNGKNSISSHGFDGLDVRAVRGPRTQLFLARLGVQAPSVFGDPALLIPHLFPELGTGVRKVRRLGIVPNFHEVTVFREHPGFISPIGAPREVIRDIIASEIVLASSLHGLIIAEAYGIPAIALASSVEPPFKYLDYYEGTGRRAAVLANSIRDGERLLASVERSRPLAPWSSAPLLDAFPYDLWES